MLADYDRTYGLKTIFFSYLNAAWADPAGLFSERYDSDSLSHGFRAFLGKKLLSLYSALFITLRSLPAFDVMVMLPIFATPPILWPCERCSLIGKHNL